MKRNNNEAEKGKQQKRTEDHKRGLVKQGNIRGEGRNKELKGVN